jgi:hypothetical protein
VKITLRALALTVLLGATLTVGGCNVSGPKVVGSGVVKSEPREVGAFTRVESAGSANVAIQIGEKESVVVETDDNILPLIDTIVKGDRLVIGSRESYSTRLGVKVTIVVPALQETRLSGSGEIGVSGLAAQAFEAHVTGSGDIHLRGTSDSLNAAITGSGGIDATELSAGAADARITGSGKIEIVATKSLDAKITGSGDVRYGGNPARVETKVTGSGNVRPM